MPQLGQYQWISDVVFFLYPSVEDAQKGTAYGGTGFLVGVASEQSDARHFHIHGVTNWHVACQAGASVIRINRRDGGTDTFDFGPDEWTFIPGWHDIAVSPPLQLDRNIHKAEAIWSGVLMSQEDISKYRIGPAEDVFMVGRFIDFDGAETNEPAYRFGNISILDAPVRQETGFSENSFVIDMHSRTGFSGSPVWVYRTPGTVFPFNNEISTSWHFIKLLGIHWGQFREKWQIKEGQL